MAFNILPIELNQEIAHYLESDKDLVAFAAVCQNSRDAVQSDGGSFWHRRFRDRYALAAGRHDNSILRRKYQKRSKTFEALRHISFTFGHTKNETKALAVIRELITESFTGELLSDTCDRVTCRNMDELAEFVKRSYTLKRIYGVSPDGKGKSSTQETYNWGLAAVQLMCAHIFFVSSEGICYGDNYLHPSSVNGFPESQRMTYASAAKQPIFTGLDRNIINMEYILNTMNFFRYYTTHKSNKGLPLYEAYRDLNMYELPSAWESALEQHNDKIGTYWKGTYAYLDHDELKDIRSSKPSQNMFLDKNVDGSNSDNPIQSLVLKSLSTPTGLTDRTSDDAKPMLETTRITESMIAKFSEILRVNQTPKDPRTRAQRRTRTDSPSRSAKPVSFEGEGEDDGEFCAAGWISDLPIQEGIPGWKRISFIKYYVDDEGMADANSLWAYEGVVLPGGKMILGRWWLVNRNNISIEEDEDLYSGPFILWNVDPRHFDPPIKYDVHHHL